MAGLKIALDASYSLGEQLTGVGVYSRELLRGLAVRWPEAYVWAYRSDRWLRAVKRGDPAPRGCVRRPFFEAWTPACDLFHGLNQRLPRARARVSVATFHDLFVMTGDYSTPEFRARFAAQASAAAKRASHIIAVSRFTAGQVRDLLDVAPERITVVHHGVRAPEPRPKAAREPLILFTGAIQVRKNVERLVEAFERLPPGWRLVLAGSFGHGAEAILDRIRRSPRRDSIETPGWVPDQVLTALYGRASIFAFPSLDEGFGIPVLEAMAQGVPVLTSNRSALPEAAGDAALLVDPFDTDAIAAGLRRLIEDEAERERLRLAGIARVREFTWERAVDETYAVYERLLRTS